MRHPPPKPKDGTSWRHLTLFLPFIWPKTLHLQVCFIISFLLLGVSSLVNFYTPLYSKLVVDSMSPDKNGNVEFRWDLACIYIFLRYLAIIKDVREIFWQKVESNINREIQVGLFAHIHRLPLSWHLNRKTGEVLSILDRTVDSIGGLLQTLCFFTLPILIDATVSLSYFSIHFDLWFASIILVFMILSGMAVYGSVQRGSKLKEERQAANETRNQCIDSLINFETVRYFCNENYEIGQFRKAVTQMDKGSTKRVTVDTLWNALESLVINSSFLVGTLIVIHKVVRTKDLTLGDYVLFTTHFIQLFDYVNWLIYLYKSFQRSMVNVANIVEILREEKSSDSGEATELALNGGCIEFKNIFFEYNPDHPVLKNVSFFVPAGQTLAIVGPTGSGKSTIIKLLFRFYDTVSGSIMIDGQNIKNITEESLRNAIGVVPQDTVLFNNTIKYNVHYGKLSAEEKEIIEATEVADIHKNIIKMKEGYDTKVGERGLKLSGGEKQRVAIARTILKAPEIVLLDEATSSLDTRTERQIQDCLNKVCSNKSTIIVAHRLSTVTHADQIIVLKDGTIIERGSHQELLDLKGTYAAMWNEQLTSHNSNHKLKNT